MNKLKYLLLACLAAGFLHTANVVAASSSNTLVRFQLRSGVSLFGNIDVELFDHDKPVTVSNFLHYVRSGAFNSTFLDYVRPGYFVAGGTYSVANPYSDALFEDVTTIPENPAISNEFNTTRIIPNLAGTLAMSLSYQGEGTNETTVRDSATTSWFFNLWDNSSADPSVDYDGQGFVVFGRVVKGMKYLNYFNSISTNNHVLDMNGDTFLFSECSFPLDGTNEVSFSGLPITFDLKFDDEFRCVQYNDVFNVNISVLRATNRTDNAAPKFKLLHPKSTTIITTNFLTVTGLVSDVGTGVQSVQLHLNGAPYASAIITSNKTFFADITALPAGSNYLLAEFTDNAGNRQILATTFFYEVKIPFKVFYSGTGSGKLNGLNLQQPLEDNVPYMVTYDRIYSIKAIADPTNLFAGWIVNNESIGNQNPLSLQMRTNSSVSNLQVTAVFDLNPFIELKGVYNGLVVSPSPVNPSHSGFLTLNLTDSGNYSAKILMNGYSIPFSGRFRTGLSITNQYVFLRSSEIIGGLPFASALLMGFDMSSDPIPDQIVGQITDWPGYTNLYATILADRVPTFTGTNRSPHTGKYTMTFPSEGSSESPAGDGYGLVTVSAKGAVTLVGSLADGTKITQKASLSKTGHWPLYLTPLKTNAALISWVNFTNEPASDLSGLFNWFKYRNTTKYYTNGFTNEAMIVGSRFLGPNTTNQTLFLTNAIAGFTNGNLVADFTNHVGIAPNGKVTNQGSNKLSLSISSGNGLMSGSVTPPAGTRAVPFKGVVLQKQTNAAGYFLGTNASGRVQLSR